MALYLTCELCGRKQADGLLSGATWARIEVRGPGMNGGAARVCPWCQNERSDWRSQVGQTISGASEHGIEASG